MTDHTLSSLGWTPHFARQQTDATLHPARVAAVHRTHLEVLEPTGPRDMAVSGTTGAYAVGDWLLHDGIRARQRLTPVTEISRKMAGNSSDRQLIAANVDTLAIVTSCNADFSVGRMERYLAVAGAAGCLPLIILTKADMAGDPGGYVRQAQRLSPLVTALAIDSRDSGDIARLHAWAGPGQTLALVGSSGVGKTTIVNALSGRADLTQGIREDDARGRHTTTFRALRPALPGGWIIDTPGMRELALSDAADGIAALFGDIGDLATQCRFSDCKHDGEPGCAVQAAIVAGDLDPDRLRRQRKMEREDQHNTESWHERHARFRAFGKMTRAGKARADHKRAGPEPD